MLDLVLGDEAASEVRRLGKKNVLVFRDLLSVGRSDVDPARHLALRMAQWEIDEREAREGHVELDGIPPDEPIALWTARTWPGRLFEWHTIAQLERLGVERARVSLVELEPSGLVHVVSLEDQTARAALDLWARFCDPSPLRFDEARRDGVPAYPDLARVADGWGAWFPRLDGDALRLSWADQLLFEGATRRAEIADVLMPWIGDSNVVARLDDWTRLGAFDAAHALTPLGERLRDEGARDVAELAPLDLGGCRINDPASPWVRTPVDGGWRLVAAAAMATAVSTGTP